MDRPADDLLMRKVRDGDVNSLSSLFERHHLRLFQFFARLTGRRDAAEDLVQEVFLRMLKYRQTYGAGTEFRAWMYQIARNTFADSLHRKRAEVVSLSDARQRGEEGLPSAEPAPEERLQRDQESRLLEQALAALAVDKREVLVLSRYEDLRYEDIARILGCEVGTVKVRVYRAMRELSRLYFELAGEKAS